MSVGSPEILRPNGTVVELAAGMELDLLFRDKEWHRVTIDKLVRCGFDRQDIAIFWKRDTDDGSVILRPYGDIEHQGGAVS